MRVLVTGGLGFQGAHLVCALAHRGHEVVALNTPSPRAKAMRDQYLRGVWKRQPNVDVVLANAADPEILEKVVVDVDAIAHLAAWASVDVSLPRPWPAHEINATGTVALLDAARRFARKHVRIVVASSCEVYGPAKRLSCASPDARPHAHHRRVEDDRTKEPLYRPIPCPIWERQTESDEMRPRSPYAASKVAADRYAYAYAVAYDLNLTILRPSNVYGPWQRAGGMGAVLPTMTKAALERQPILITGDGTQAREFTWVDDVVRVYEWALAGHAAEPGEAFNVGSGEVRTVLEVAEAVVKRYGGAIRRVPERVADTSSFALDSSKLLRSYRGSFVDFAGGLETFFRWADEEGRRWLSDAL